MKEIVKRLMENHRVDESDEFDYKSYFSQITLEDLVSGNNKAREFIENFPEFGATYGDREYNGNGIRVSWRGKQAFFLYKSNGKYVGRHISGGRFRPSDEDTYDLDGAVRNLSGYIQDAQDDDTLIQVEISVYGYHDWYK